MKAFYPRKIRWRDRVRHALRGCWPEPRPMFYGHVWHARWCPVCGKYPYGRWRLSHWATDELGSW